MATQKTNAEWEQIKFKNNLGPQIGGLLHDAVALTIAFNKNKPGTTPISNDIKDWLDYLYEIAEAKKKELTTIDIEKSVELGKKHMEKLLGITSKDRMDKANAMFEQSRGELQEQKDHEESQDWDAQTKEGRKFRKELEKEEQEDSGWEHTKDSPEKQVPFK